MTFYFAEKKTETSKRLLCSSTSVKDSEQTVEHIEIITQLPVICSLSY